MGEALISRSGGGTGSTEVDIPIIQGYHSLLVTVRDSNNRPFENISVHCKDGNTWYNYATNEKGQVIFMANSGTVNVTAYNFDLNTGIKWIDQQSASLNNIAAVVGSSNRLNFTLNAINRFTATTQNTSNIYNAYYNKNLMVRCHDFMNIFVGAGGGGGGGSDWRLSVGGETAGGYGGGGGGAAYVQNKVINKNTKYTFSIGGGGRRGTFSVQYGDSTVTPGGSGGTTTAFGVSAYGGSGGGTVGFSGGQGSGGWGSYSKLAGETYSNYYGGAATQNSTCTNWGGGGASFSRTVAGKPGGGSLGGSGYNGGGGGAGARGSYDYSNQNGGSGGGGRVDIEFY